MKVVLTHAYYINQDPKEQQIMKPYPPLGILSIAGWIEQKGISNAVVDSTFINQADHIVALEKESPDIIGIYANLVTKLNLVKLVADIRQSGKLRHVKILLGGPDIRYNWKNYLKLGVDAVIIGEGEQTFEALCRAYEHNTTVDDIDGIAYAKDGDFIKNKERIKLRDIDELPFPARDKIDLQAYLDCWKNHHGKSSVSVSTQRGCPYTCKWCSTAVYGQSYRRRSPALVVAEIKHLIDTYGAESIWFVDDVFTVSHKWISGFHDEMKKAGITIPFECITRAERLNETVLKQLKEMGCFRIWIGAESGSQKIIDKMDRRVSVETVRNMIQTTRAHGIEAGTFIMVGYPDETIDDIKETIHHLKTSNPDLFTITLSYPIKGTGLYEEVEKQIIGDPDWFSTTDRDLDFNRTYGRRFYHYAIRKIVNEVNAHKSRVDKGIVSATFVKQKMKSIAAGIGMTLSK